MDKYSNWLVIILMATSLVLTACSSERQPFTADLSAQITLTMQAVATQAQATLLAVVPTSLSPTSTLEPTGTPPPTATLAPTQPPVPTLEGTSTPESLVPPPIALILEDTNCRSGPSIEYPVIFLALKGQDLKIVLDSGLSNYVVVENPQTPGQYCWLWTQSVEVHGDLSGLQAATPPPLPTPAVKFTFAFERVEVCNGYSLAFRVVNTDSRTMQSYKILAIDFNTDKRETTTANNFDRRMGCTISDRNDLLNPGETGFIYANGFSYDPSGHAFNITVTVCSHNDLAGVCETQATNFIP